MKSAENAGRKFPSAFNPGKTQQAKPGNIQPKPLQKIQSNIAVEKVKRTEKGLVISFTKSR
jgi:hypothetical protein